MGVGILVIVVTALVLIAFAVLDIPRWRKRTRENQEPSHIEKVREAAYAVIEASLEAEPEKWEAIQGNGRVHRLENSEKNISIFLYDGVMGVHVNLYTPFRGGKIHKARYDPPPSMKQRLYEVGVKIAVPKIQEEEKDDLADLVSVFSEKRSNSHDQETA